MRLSYLSLLPAGQGRLILLPFMTTSCRTLPSPFPYLTLAFPPTALQSQGCHQPRGSPWPNLCSDTGWLKADILESFLSPCSCFPRLTQVLLTIPPVCLWSSSIFLFSATLPRSYRHCLLPTKWQQTPLASLSFSVPILTPKHSRRGGTLPFPARPSLPARTRSQEAAATKPEQSLGDS